MTKKYILEIDENQARTLEKALDLYSRIGMGQLREIINVLRYDERLDNKNLEVARNILDNVKLLVFGDDFYGIYSHEVPDVYRVAWDIQRVIRHQLWLD